MSENNRSKIIELTEKAIAINEKRLLDQKEFIKEASIPPFNVNYLKEKIEELNELAVKEQLYLGAVKSRLKKLSENKVI